MPRIIVTTDPSPLSADAPVWLDEHLHSVHLSTAHAAAQLIERLAWAISDAEDADGERADHPSAAQPTAAKKQIRHALPHHTITRVKQGQQAAPDHARSAALS
jgi:hypothetical protein